MNKALAFQAGDQGSIPSWCFNFNRGGPMPNLQFAMDYRRPMKPFFNNIPNFRQIGQINFGVFLVELSAPILAL